tara:strand:- start:10721 stop:10972 length:252 start_codon:yes stop_codon:yes gene_type:complete
MDLGKAMTTERAEAAMKALDLEEARNKELTKRVKELEFDCAELVKENTDLSERVKKLAMRQPSWPKGFRPQGRRHDRNREQHR